MTIGHPRLSPDARSLAAPVAELYAQAGQARRPGAALDDDTRRAARAFLRRLDRRYAVRDAFLFGSRARGAHMVDSDADIAVVLNGARGDRIAAALDMAGIAFDVF